MDLREALHYCEKVNEAREKEAQAIRDASRKR